MANTKDLLGAEDCLLGQGQVEQARFGSSVVISKINSDTIPYIGEKGDANYQSVKTVIDNLLLGTSLAVVEW